jgi:hypothetical protein
MSNGQFEDMQEWSRRYRDFALRSSLLDAAHLCRYTSLYI